MIYTVGHEESYDAQLACENAHKFEKLGRNGSYPGGFAVKTPHDAARLIAEWGKVGDWAIYEVDADWAADTAPSLQGWWHALARDARILQKVEVPLEHPAHWQVELDQPAVRCHIIAPMDESKVVSDWVYSRGGRITSRCLIVIAGGSSLAGLRHPPVILTSTYHDS